MREKLTERARKVMELAAEEARRMNHEYIGTEHVLLGLAVEGAGAGAKVLKALGADLGRIRPEVEKLIKPGPEPIAPGTLPHTPRLKKAIEHGLAESKKLGHNYVGTEHLLLGLLDQREGVAAQALIHLGLEPERVRAKALELLGVPPGADGADDQVAAGAAEDEQTKRYVNQLIAEAAKTRASDIHLEPTEDRRGRVRLRIDGVLQDQQPPAEGMFAKAMERFKVMADMDVGEHRLPQDGRIMARIDGKGYDLRVSVVPTLYGQRMALRLLDRESVVVDLPRIGFDEADLARVKGLCHLPNGMVIASGPTGSGKTTLLYGMLMEANAPGSCLFTVEDPVEYSFAGVSQIQVDGKVGLTFARAMRHILRQDPDVILVGEIRDLEVLQACVQCALTGHLVLTTLHAGSAAGAIRRVLDVGIAPFMVNSAVAGVVSQRLIRLLCPACKQPAKPQADRMPPEAVELVQGLKGATFYAPTGCPQCRGTGYAGLTAMHEILVMDEPVRRAVSQTPDLSAIHDAAVAAGMKTMLADGLQKAARGITSIEEVLRVSPRGPNI